MTSIDESTFEQEVSGLQPPGLARAALLYAREIAYPGLRPSVYLQRFDEWAEMLRKRFRSATLASTRLRHLTGFLFEELGLKGNRTHYDDPRNSYLNEVLDRRLGLPITLSVVFLEMAERLELAAEGIGLPGHFLVAVHTEQGRLFLDPFNKGVEVTPKEAMRLVRQTTQALGEFRPQWLAPVAPRAILTRMLVNLKSSYLQREAWTPCLAVIERLRLLQPQAPEHVRDLGLIHYQRKAQKDAVPALQEYLVRYPSAPDAPRIRHTLEAALRQLARLN